MSAILQNAMLANLQLLSASLVRASTLADMAVKAMRDDHRNLAIGTLLPLEEELPTLVGLLTAILALHRRAGQGGLS